MCNNIDKNYLCRCSQVTESLFSIFFLCQMYVIPVNEMQLISTGKQIINLETITNKSIKYRILIYILFPLYFWRASDWIIPKSNCNSFLMSEIKDWFPPLHQTIFYLSLCRPLSPSYLQQFHKYKLYCSIFILIRALQNR